MLQRRSLSLSGFSQDVFSPSSLTSLYKSTVGRMILSEPRKRVSLVGFTSSIYIDIVIVSLTCCSLLATSTPLESPTAQSLVSCPTR